MNARFQWKCHHPSGCTNSISVEHDDKTDFSLVGNAAQAFTEFAKTLGWRQMSVVGKRLYEVPFCPYHVAKP